MKYRWLLSDCRPDVCQALALELKISALLAQCLLNRGISDPSAINHFLNPRLKFLADPFLIPNMAVGVNRLLLARSNGEPLVIFGDYDVDGVTSTALLVEVLSKLGWKVSSYLPHRMDEGYGLSDDGVKNCLEKFPVKLLLAVDCGSNALDAISSLQTSGVEVIVLDHHQISTPPPPAVALINPRVAGDSENAPFVELCSAGLSFKLAHALLKRLRDENVACALNLDLRDCLDLVALGTIADLVPLTGENRLLVSAGLERLGATNRPGLIALKTVAQCGAVIGGYEVGFQLAPRLNASGRLEKAEESLNLLLSPSLEVAEPIARALDSHNRERQSIERAIAQDIIASIRARFDPERDFVIIEGQADWHVGVVGIVASRVLAEFHRPSIILGGEGEKWRGSGRSIAGFDLAAALRQCDDLLARHGGHAMAAGVTLHPDNIVKFRSRLNEIARTTISPENLQPSLKLDAEVLLSDLTIERLEELARLDPTGQGNAQVRLVCCGVKNHQAPQRMGKENQHVKLRVTDGKKVLEAVWWNCGDAAMPTGFFDLAFVPQINSYNGRSAVQLKMIDWRQ